MLSLSCQAEARPRTSAAAALAGDPVALRLCLERIIPARKSRPVRFELPRLTTAADGPAAIAAVAEAAAAANLSLDEADQFAKLVESFVKTFEIGDIERRLRALETAADK